MSTTITTQSRHTFGGIARRERHGTGRASQHFAPAHIAERAYAAELAHAERSARMRENAAAIALGSPR
jgi:hypothetical protein